MDKMDLVEAIATVRTLAIVLDKEIENIVLDRESLDNSVRISGFLLEKLDTLYTALTAPAK